MVERAAVIWADGPSGSPLQPNKAEIRKWGSYVERQQAGSGLDFAFSATTSDADPGAGTFRLNNATVASVTAIYIDNVDALGTAVGAILDSWDDSTNPVRGILNVRGITNDAVLHVFRVTGSVVDGAGYRKVTVSYIGGSGAFVAADDYLLTFSRSGEPGAVNAIVPGSGISVNSTDPANPVVSVASGLTFNQATTGFFWSDLGTPRIHRMTDRVFVGSAVANDGKLTNTTADWLSTAMKVGRNAGFQTTNVAQFASLSSIGQIAVLGGTRASDIGQTTGTIAGAFFAVNDQAAFDSGVYGLYVEAHREATAIGSAQVYEGDIINKGTVVSINPYAMFASGLTCNLWVASGGEYVGATNASAAIGILNNGARYDKGIVFHATALNGTDGTGTGTGIAIQMARGQKVQWARQSGTLAADIFSDITNGGPYQLITFTDLGLLYRNTNAKNLLRVDAADNFANGFVMFPKALGSTPLFQAVGDDTNVGLGIATQGTGTVDFYTNTSVRQLQVAHVASAVNYVRNSGAITTAAPLISVDGSDTNIGLGHATKGTGVFDFFTNTNVRQLQVAHIAGAVNYLKTAGAATTASPTISVDGSDTNVTFAHATKGTGVFDFFTNTNVRQLQIAHVATAVNYLQLKGSATTGAPAISVQGSDTNAALVLTSKGTESVYVQSGGQIAAQFQTAASTVNWLFLQGAATNGQPIITATGSDTNVTGILRGRGAGGWQIQDGAAGIKFAANTTGIGFNGTAPVAKPTVTGAKGGNAALTSLLTQLASTGLITDSTT
ncbi:hypothetical protein [Mesorhizobium australicum]|uniref:hypothetical protein n=1 Tax=Mesorhizobium australicum TaxID=536018 RepID=UPI0033373DFD